MSSSQARGVLFCHAVPRALCQHVEWAVRDVLGGDARLEWTPQPIAPATMRAEVAWSARPGTAARIASALRVVPGLRFEVTEEPCRGRDGERYLVTPSLGMHRATMGVHGDVLVGEDRLRALLSAAARTEGSIADGLAHLLGAPWDAELEPFRVAGEDTPVRVLHRVG